MLVNPGGPGGSGLGLARWAERAEGRGDPYDWIGFDPRGVGAQRAFAQLRPRLLRGYGRPRTCRTTPAVSTLVHQAAAYADACAAEDGQLLDHLTTVDSARTWRASARRSAQKKINFYGFSYGTYLGQVYATMYPTRVRRVVLRRHRQPDATSGTTPTSSRTVAFDTNINTFFDWIAENDAAYDLGTAVTRSATSTTTCSTS